MILVPRLVFLKPRTITVTYRCPPFSRVWLGETLARMFLRVRLHKQYISRQISWDRCRLRHRILLLPFSIRPWIYRVQPETVSHRNDATVRARFQKKTLVATHLRDSCSCRGSKAQSPSLCIARTASGTKLKCCGKAEDAAGEGFLGEAEGCVSPSGPEKEPPAVLF